MYAVLFLMLSVGEHYGTFAWESMFYLEVGLVVMRHDSKQQVCFADKIEYHNAIRQIDFHS